MENKGVTCDVCECVHNMGSCKCDVPEIKVTKETAQDAVETPHFCKTFEAK